MRIILFFLSLSLSFFLVSIHSATLFRNGSGSGVTGREESRGEEGTDANCFREAVRLLL